MWLARNKDGELYFYNTRPFLFIYRFIAAYKGVKWDEERVPLPFEVKFENSPIEIKLTIKKQRRNKMKELNEYQNAAKTTAIFDKKYDVIYPALGMNGEAGEVAEKVKKVIRDHNGEMTDETKLEIVKEIGDVMWYCAVLADRLGYTLKEVANINIEKLASRKKRNMINGNGDNR